ncbi:hypothetical protein [Agromyces larvae]|uniref:Uncharacterized protein n=1 Tax=Agromyces larvae TaxID=2929802 RepID=A0ABY4BVL5_9MICO|nr:hypothetical protein [Agromyces larvae]UOE43215.1 hypothetical protein MTO99_13600 [Agromyces larvae]
MKILTSSVATAALAAAKFVGTTGVASAEPLNSDSLATAISQPGSLQVAQDDETREALDYVVEHNKPVDMRATASAADVVETVAIRAFSLDAPSCRFTCVVTGETGR